MKAWVERKKLCTMVILKGGGEAWQVACAAFGSPPASERRVLPDRARPRYTEEGYFGRPRWGVSVYRGGTLRYTEMGYFGRPRWGTSVYRGGVLRYTEKWGSHGQEAGLRVVAEGCSLALVSAGRKPLPLSAFLLPLPQSFHDRDRRRSTADRNTRR